MAGRTITLGDIHGGQDELRQILAALPVLDSRDTLVFLGDYVDRGPRSREVVEALMALPGQTQAQVVCLRGNHEDAWLRVREHGWDEFVLPPEHGCLPTLRSFLGTAADPADPATDRELELLSTGAFWPDSMMTWFAALPYWYENEQAIYVHAGLPRGSEGFLHPREVEKPALLAWVRTDDFIRNYRGKRVLFGHTPVILLPPELSTHTPDDVTDLWTGDSVMGLDTGCGRGGFLTAVELPSLAIFETRER